jgi:hypothetical protein
MRRLRNFYGAGPVHLLATVLCLALAAGAVTIVADDPSWLRMLVWFLAAVLLHDLVLFPFYTAADRVFGTVTRRPRRVPLVNHVRIPLLGAGLTFLLFLPGIIRQGEPAVRSASGLDQSPFLGRWLLLVAAMAGVSAIVYGVRVLLARRPGSPGDPAPPTGPDRPTEPSLHRSGRVTS